MLMAHLSTSFSNGFRVLDYVLLGVLLYIVNNVYVQIRRRVKTTALRGPPSPSWLYGMARELHSTNPERSSDLYEEWVAQYGDVLSVPSPMGKKTVILADPKAISHLYATDTFDYVQNALTRIFIRKIIGRGILWAEGEDHRRQRRALTPAFSNQAIRTITPIFFDSAYKVKTAWDALLETSTAGVSIIDVQEWMNCVSLDSIGIAGFSHDFGTLEGHQSDIADFFAHFTTQKISWLFMLVLTLGSALPFLGKIPTGRNRLTQKLQNTMEKIGAQLLNQTRDEIGASGVKRERSPSIIGAVVNAENSGSEIRMSSEEALAQMQVLILAGYETTSISLTWALIELCRDQKRQEKLRAELSEFSTADPTWDQLTNELPYLNSVVREILRLHPPVSETIRISTKDDVIPLGTTVTTRSGELVDRIHIAKGALLTVPIRTMNRSTAVWGPDAKEFIPERWLNQQEDGSEGLPKKASEIGGYKHLLTFIDGPRICIGRGFALAEFKVVLSVLIRNYKFDLRDGPDTPIETIRALLPRPQVVGEEGCRMPMKVTRIE